MLLIPPNLALIFRHKFDRVWGLYAAMFLACTHWVAMPSAVSPTLFTSAGDKMQIICYVRVLFKYEEGTGGKC